MWCCGERGDNHFPRPSAAVVGSVTFLTLIDVIGKSWTFWVYAIFAVLGIGFVWRFVPETKGRPLEHIDEYWTNGHHWPQVDSSQPDR